MSTLYENMQEIDRVLSESPKTDAEKKNAEKAQEYVKAAKNLNNLTTGIHGIAAGTAAASAGLVASKLTKVNKEIKNLEKLIKEESDKKNPNEEALDQLKTELKSLKKKRASYIATLGYDAVVGGTYVYKTAKGVARGKKIDDVNKDLDLQKKVVATYDKDGVKEESATESTADEKLKEFKRKNIEDERSAILKNLVKHDDDLRGTAMIAGSGAVSSIMVSKKIKKLEDQLKKAKEENKPDDEIKNLEKRVAHFKRAKKLLIGATAVSGAGAVASYSRVSNDERKLNDLSRRERELDESTLYDNMCAIDAFLTEAANDKELTFKYNGRDYKIYINSKFEPDFIKANRDKIIGSCVNLLKREKSIITTMLKEYKITGEDAKKSHIDGFEVVDPKTYDTENSFGYVIGVFEFPNQIEVVFNGTNMLKNSFQIY